MEVQTKVNLIRLRALRAGLRVLVAFGLGSGVMGLFLHGVSYQAKGKAVKRFTMAVSKRLSTVEEFYRMYYLPAMFTEEDLHRNMFWLQVALKVPFSVPIQALVVPETEEQYQKYQVLMKMHLHYLLTKNAIFLAARYDKHKPVFHDKPFKKEILESLSYARYNYEVAQAYWKEVMRHHARASRMKGVRVRLDFLNDLGYRIRAGDLNYHRVAARRLGLLQKKVKFYEKL